MILVTNDDGIEAPGLHALVLELSSIATVIVCAPKEEQSASSHALTVRESLLVEEVHMDGAHQAWSVDGKPADCVKLAVLGLVKEPIMLVIAGINKGSNLGTDTLYSGTVAAAMEGAFHGLPAIAVSLCLGQQIEEPIDFSPAAKIVKELVGKWVARDLWIHGNSMLNVNIPHIPDTQRKGYTFARLGVQHYTDEYKLVQDSTEETRYQLHGERIPTLLEDESLDSVAVARGYVSITPLSTDRTDYGLLEEMKKKENA